MKIGELRELKSYTEGLAMKAYTLANELKAIYAARNTGIGTPEMYEEVIQGLSQQGYQLKEELQLFVDWLNEVESVAMKTEQKLHFS